MTWLAFFAATFVLNLLVALIQWYLMQNSVKMQLSSLAAEFTSFWDAKLDAFDISIAA